MIVHAELEFDFINSMESSKEINKKVKRWIKNEKYDCKVVHLYDQTCLVLFYDHQRLLADRLYELGYYNSLREAQDDLNEKIIDIDPSLQDPYEYEMKQSIYDDLNLSSKPDGFIDYLMKVYKLSDHQIELRTKIPFEDFHQMPFNLISATRVHALALMLMIDPKELNELYFKYIK